MQELKQTLFSHVQNTEIGVRIVKLLLAEGILRPDYADAFSKAKARIRNMDYRFVEENYQMRQALLEAYVCIALETPYNDFNTH